MTIQTLKDELRARDVPMGGVERMVFVLSPGRCGTLYLSRVFNTVPGVCALHESPPFFHHNIQLEYADRLHWLKETKLGYILGRSESVYVETSGQFMRGWSELFIDLDVIPDAIRLRRDHREVALSVWRRGTIPARSHIGVLFNAQPDDADGMLQIENYSHWTDYQLCYWNSIEIEKRCDKYSLLLSNHGAQVVEATYPEITTQAGFFKVLDALGLDKPDPILYSDIYRVRFNQTLDEHANNYPEGDLDEQEQEVMHDVTNSDCVPASS